MSDDFPISIGERPLEPEIPPRPSYAERIERAERLITRVPASAQMLRFYGGVAAAQQRIYELLASSGERPAEQHSWPLRTELVVPLFPEFARQVGSVAPEAVREELRSLGGSVERFLVAFWSGTLAEAEVAKGSIALSFLQPYAEWLAQNTPTLVVTTHAACPICTSEPMCAVLRDKDHGASRGLICSLCMNEWSFPRVTCPSCGENRFEQLPVFTPEADPHVRVDACETCKQYIKTIDMTKDGHAVPVVDELAAASLDLWARENGYRKVTLNLAGL